VLRPRFGDPGQYELRIISMREQQFRSDFARGTLAERTSRIRAQGPHQDARSRVHRAYEYSIDEEENDDAPSRR
jgi:hypothetical protein